METIHQLFASLDIFSVLLHAFPSILNPLVHGFQSLFSLLFTSLKHIVMLNPGLICGTVFMSLVYFLFAAFSRLHKVRA
ncbi:MAG: hypothetical protein WCK34_05680 [Bacteroidota bacterium]